MSFHLSRSRLLNHKDDYLFCGYKVFICLLQIATLALVLRSSKTGLGHPIKLGILCPCPYVL